MGKLELTVEPGKQEIVFTREFDAPVDRVFRAYVEADAIKQWWGGRMHETKIDTFEPRAGGSWRFVGTGPDGGEYGFHGVFHEVLQNERIIWTFEFEGAEPGHVSLETIYFSEENGKTKIRTIAVYQSVADRDGMVESGMEKGLSEGLDVLAEIAEKA